MGLWGPTCSDVAEVPHYGRITGATYYLNIRTGAMANEHPRLSARRWRLTFSQSRRRGKITF
jgi:hypothetical protein